MATNRALRDPYVMCLIRKNLADLSTSLRTDGGPKFTGSERLCCRYNAMMVLAQHVVIITSVQRHSIRHNDVTAAAGVIVALSARARCVTF